MEHVVNHIGCLLGVESVLAHFIIDDVRALSHAAEREHERSDNGPNAACYDVDDDNGSDLWTAIKAIEHQRDAYFDGSRYHKADDILREVELEIVLSVGD